MLGKLHSIGRYLDPEDRLKPYWVKVEFGSLGVVQQPVSEQELFTLLNKVIHKFSPIDLKIELV